MERNCGIWTVSVTQVTWKAPGANEGVALIPLTKLQSPSGIFPAAGLQGFLRGRFCSRGLQWGIGSWNPWWIFLWERDGASCSVPCKEPSFTGAQCDNWEGVSWSWMLPARGQQLLFHLAFLWHPWWSPSMELELSWWAFVAKRHLLEEQHSSACWEWITNCGLRYLENTSIH